MEAGLCLHGTKVAFLCKRLTFALHTPVCTPLSMLRRCDPCTIHTHTPALTRAMPSATIAGAGVPLPCSHACILLLLHRAPAIRGSFAPPQNQLCRKNSLDAPCICLCTVGAPLVGTRAGSAQLSQPSPTNSELTHTNGFFQVGVFQRQ